MPTPAPPPRGADDLVEVVAQLLEPAHPAGTGGDRARQLAVAGVRVLGADAACVLVLDGAGAPGEWAGSDHRAEELCHAEASRRDGPALDCCRTGRRGRIGVVEAGRRWPLWARSAAGAGWTAADAVPLLAGATSLGGMVLLHRGTGPHQGAGPPGGVAGAGAGLLAVTAAAAIRYDRALADAVRRADQLQTALVSRIVIEQAKGVLAERGGLEITEAFDRMRRYARARRRKLAEVAAEVVGGDAADEVLTHARPLPGAPSILEP